MHIVEKSEMLLKIDIVKMIHLTLANTEILTV